MTRIQAWLTVVYFVAQCCIGFAQSRGWPLSAAWSPDGETIAVGSSTGVWFFDNAFTELGFVKTIPETITQSSLSIDWNAAGDMLAVGYPGGHPSGPIHVIGFADQEIITVIDYPDIYAPVAWHPLSNLILSGDWWGNSSVWDAVTGERVYSFHERDMKTAGFTNSTLAACWDSEHAIVAIQAFEVYFVNTLEDRIIKHFDAGFPLDRATCGYERTALTERGHLLDLQTGAVTRVFLPPPGAIGTNELYARGAALSPNSRKIAINDEGCRIRVVDAQRGKLLAELEGGIIQNFRFSYTYSVSWRPDGEQFLTVGQLGDIRIWDGQSYELIRRFDGFEMAPELAERELPVLRDADLLALHVNDMKCLREFSAMLSRLPRL